MKNLIFYYLLIVTPFLAILFLGRDIMDSTQFTIALLTYVLIYRPVTDYYRLKAVTGFKGDKLLTLVIPFYGHFKYFKELYLTY